MPLSIRLAALIAIGAVAGLHLPSSAWRLCTAVTAAAALSSWLALRRAVTGAAAILFAVAVAGAGAARAMVAADAAERPALMRWFERESGGTPAGESRIRERAGSRARHAGPRCRADAVRRPVAAVRGRSAAGRRLAEAYGRRGHFRVGDRDW